MYLRNTHVSTIFFPSIVSARFLPNASCTLIASDGNQVSCTPVKSFFKVSNIFFTSIVSTECLANVSCTSNLSEGFLPIVSCTLIATDRNQVFCTLYVCRVPIIHLMHFIFDCVRRIPIQCHLHFDCICRISTQFSCPLIASDGTQSFVHPGKVFDLFLVEMQIFFFHFDCVCGTPSQSLLYSVI